VLSQKDQQTPQSQRLGTNRAFSQISQETNEENVRGQLLISNWLQVHHSLGDHLLIIIYEMVIIPFRMAFTSDNSETFTWIDFGFDAFFMLDIILSFNTSIYLRGFSIFFYFWGNLIFNRKLIAKQYIKFWFWIDVISSFPYEMVTEGDVFSLWDNF
jgi:hypothetical protein